MKSTNHKQWALLCLICMVAGFVAAVSILTDNVIHPVIGFLVIGMTLVLCATQLTADISRNRKIRTNETDLNG